MAKTFSKYLIEPEQMEELRTLLRKGTTPQNVAKRARIVLLSAEGKNTDEVRKETGAAKGSVFTWRKRFLKEGLAGLKDKPRSGQPTKIDDEMTKKVLQWTTESVPAEASHWSERLMAEHAGISRWMVQRIWEKAGLKPHRLKKFKISNDPHFADKVIDVVGLYMNPPDNAIVLSVDEKTQIQALDRTQPMFPMKLGKSETWTYDYKRNDFLSVNQTFTINFTAKS